MHRLSLSITLVLLAGLSVLHAQTIRKMRGRVGGTSYSYQVMEPSQIPKGIVVLMPSRGEKPKEVFWHTSIPKYLAARGFITIVPKVDYALILEEKTKNILNDVVSVERDRAELPALPLVIGGFSSGGSIAANYAEYIVSERGQGAVKGVFLIDPPLDLARFYNAWTKLIGSACPDVIISEGEFIKEYLEQVTGGTPHERPEHYRMLSAFTASEPSGGNARALESVPIRLYTEPDLKAMRDRYCPDLTYQNLNSSDLDALAECLKKLGNTRVEYIRTTGRGLHSWNIVEPEDLVRWVEEVSR